MSVANNAHRDLERLVQDLEASSNDAKTAESAAQSKVRELQAALVAETERAEERAKSSREPAPPPEPIRRRSTRAETTSIATASATEDASAAEDANAPGPGSARARVERRRRRRLARYHHRHHPPVSPVRSQTEGRDESPSVAG